MSQFATLFVFIVLGSLAHLWQGWPGTVLVVAAIILVTAANAWSA